MDANSLIGPLDFMCRQENKCAKPFRNAKPIDEEDFDENGQMMAPEFDDEDF